MTLLLEDNSVSPAVTMSLPLRATRSISRDAFQEIRRKMVPDFCKWDPQVADVATLAPFAVLMPQRAWRQLAEAAEQLTIETLQLENVLLDRQDLQRRIGVPSPLRKLFASHRSLTPAAARAMRFDFHLTEDGWRVSEVNSDVPGGFAESSAFARMMAEHLHGEPAGDPAAAYADALAACGQNIVLLCAAGFMEDQQVVSGIADVLERRGCDAILAQPSQLHWRNGDAFHGGARIDAIVRFYQAEWLCRLPRRTGWQHLFVDGNTAAGNPGIAVLSESKRLPLVWEEAGVQLTAWPRYLPETRDPRHVACGDSDRWVLKTAYCNTGDTVSLPGRKTPWQRLATKLDLARHPRQWIAQRRFRTLPINTPSGPMFPCIGVYTIDGVACGIYGRLSCGPVTDYQAIDVAVLIEEEHD